jgi:hypothetical protein
MLRKLIATLAGLIELLLLHAELNVLRARRDRMVGEIEMLAEVRDEVARLARRSMR